MNGVGQRRSNLFYWVHFTNRPPDRDTSGGGSLVAKIFTRVLHSSRPRGGGIRKRGSRRTFQGRFLDQGVVRDLCLSLLGVDATFRVKIRERSFFGGSWDISLSPTYHSRTNVCDSTTVSKV